MPAGRRPLHWAIRVPKVAVRVAIVLLLAVGIGVGASACGRKAPPEHPPESDFPRQYPPR